MFLKKNPKKWIYEVYKKEAIRGYGLGGGLKEMKEIVRRKMVQGINIIVVLFCKNIKMDGDFMLLV